MKLSGAQAIIKVLLEQGVDTVFGYPGGQVIPLYNALYDAPLRNVLTAHEQGAIHAADGYARASGRTGVCIATSGPGATNIVTGLATAYLDSVPLVAITGQVSVANLGRDSFQEIDIVGVTLPITKYNIWCVSLRICCRRCGRHFTWHREGPSGTGAGGCSQQSAGRRCGVDGSGATDAACYGNGQRRDIGSRSSYYY